MALGTEADPAATDASSEGTGSGGPSLLGGNRWGGSSSGSSMPAIPKLIASGVDVMVVHSELDPIPIEWNQLLVDTIPDADFVLIEGGSHFPMVEDAEQKISRPRQIYTGERSRDYVPVGER